MSQHVDSDRLHTDLMYRFEYVSSFCDFGGEDIHAIKSAAAVLAPLVPAIVDAVYDKLFSFDITKAVFLKRNEGFSGAMASDLDHLTQDSEQIRFRKGHLAKYLVKLVTGEYDEKFVMYLDKVGRVHVNWPGKASKINVEYIHCNALFGFVHYQLVAILHDAGLDREEEKAVLVAFTKLLWIQNDLFTRYYTRDGETVPGSAAHEIRQAQLEEDARN